MLILCTPLIVSPRKILRVIIMIVSSSQSSEAETKNVNIYRCVFEWEILGENHLALEVWLNSDLVCYLVFSITTINIEVALSAFCNMWAKTTSNPDALIEWNNMNRPHNLIVEMRE